MITAKKWMGVEAPLLSVLVASALYASATKILFNDCRIFNGVELMDSKAALAEKQAAISASFEGACPLDKLPMDLGAYFSNLHDLIYTPCGATLESDESPSEVHKKHVVPCDKVKFLYTELYPSKSKTPKALEWINLFFPKVSKLTIKGGFLPIQTQGDAIMGQTEDLKMESVTHLILEWKYYSKGGREEPPLLENLAFFPNIERLDIFYFLPEARMLRAMVEGKNKEPVASIKSLGLFDLFVEPELFLGIMGIFTKLEELFVSRETFRGLLKHFSEANSPFGSLKTLGIDFNNSRLQLDRIDKVFPSVTMIKLRSVPGTLFSGLNAESDSLNNITSVRVVTGDEAYYSPSYLGSIFPKVESLTLAPCEYSSLFSDNMDHERKFFSRLKYLDMSSNRHLRPIAAQMEPFRIHFRTNPNSVANPLGLSQHEDIISPTDMTFEPLAPNLETLVIRKTFKFADAPSWFFQAFPNLTRLEVSDEIFKGSTADSLFELFKPLTKLKQLDVALESAYNLPEESVLTEILNKVEKSSKSRFAVRLFSAEEFSSEVIKEFKYVACEEAK